MSDDKDYDLWWASLSSDERDEIAALALSDVLNELRAFVPPSAPREEGKT